MAEKKAKDNKKYEKALKSITEMNAKHVGAWLDQEGINRYLKKKEELNITDVQYTGMFRDLCVEMQKEFGITEIESINIMNGMHIRDYLNKYDHIKNMTPFVSNDDTLDLLISLWEKLESNKSNKKGKVYTEFDFDDYSITFSK